MKKGMKMDIEQEIKDKNLTARRVTPDDLNAEIASEQYHVFEGSCLTICCLTLKNGFTVTGQSACASPENFDAELGQKIARQNAWDEIWPLLGFRLRDELVGYGWQPISTAPTDGTFVDIWLSSPDMENGGERLANMKYVAGDTSQSNDWDDEHGFWSVVGDGCRNIQDVTHWRPRPAGPKS